MKDINGQAHWEIKSSKSTYKQAAEYCKKDGDFVEYGTLPEENQKKASVAGNEANKQKWRTINDKAKEGDLEWIDQEYPKVFNQSYKNLKQMKVDYMKRKPNLPDVCGVWYWGPSGVGKTHLVTELYPDAYLKRAQNKWFDAYQQEDVIVIDDLDDTHAYMGYELKKLADKYCYMVEVKNSSMYIRPKKCVVTSQYTIQEIWKNDKKTQDALLRRFTQVEVTQQNRAMLLSCNQIIEEKNGEDTLDINAEQFDQLMLEAEEYTANKIKTLGQKIAKQNKDIAMKRIDMEKLPKKIRPANIYYPDRRLQFPVPTYKPLERKNAMVTPPIPKPTVVPPPTPKKKRVEYVVVSSDSEPELPKEDVSEDDSQLEIYENPYEGASLEEMWCDEQLSPEPDYSSDEY